MLSFICSVLAVFIIDLNSSHFEVKAGECSLDGDNHKSFVLFLNFVPLEVHWSLYPARPSRSYPCLLSFYFILNVIVKDFNAKNVEVVLARMMLKYS